MHKWAPQDTCTYNTVSQNPKNCLGQEKYQDSVYDVVSVAQRIVLQLYSKHNFIFTTKSDRHPTVKRGAMLNNSHYTLAAREIIVTTTNHPFFVLVSSYSVSRLHLTKHIFIVLFGASPEIIKSADFIVQKASPQGPTR